jgi:hypothetical protein
MKIFTRFILLVALLGPCSAFAQGQWVFGNKAKIDFNGALPVATATGKSTNFDGTGVLCASDGKLIFIQMASPCGMLPTLQCQMAPT